MITHHDPHDIPGAQAALGALGLPGPLSAEQVGTLKKGIEGSRRSGVLMRKSFVALLLLSPPSCQISAARSASLSQA